MTKKYNWGIIGTGWIANKMADALQEVKGKVYAAANPNEDSLRAVFILFEFGGKFVVAFQIEFDSQG